MIIMIGVVLVLLVVVLAHFYWYRAL